MCEELTDAYMCTMIVLNTAVFTFSVTLLCMSTVGFQNFICHGYSYMFFTIVAVLDWFI